MELLALEGVYEDGKIKLKEPPSDVKKARVLVMFLPDELAEETKETTLVQRREAGIRLLETMRAGLSFGGEKFNREEIYEGRRKELDNRRDRH